MGPLMEKISRRSLLAASASVAISPAYSAVSPVDIPRRVRRPLDDTSYWMHAAGTPGMSIALVEGGKTREILSFGSSDLEGKQAITDQTIFQAASLSKQALLYAVIKTIDAGKLDIERPLAQYLDKPYRMDDAELGNITARHVLTHTTGWPNWPADNKPIKREHPPGTKWGYSGAGFVYLQTVLESIWGESATHYTRRLVFDPLGMNHSSFVWLDAYDQTATKGFDPGEDKPLNQWQPKEVNGAASLHTTAKEYALLLEAYLNKDFIRVHPGVFRQQVKIDDHLGWTLGWGAADNALWQWGHNDGFKAFSALVPSRGLGIVTLTNCASGQRINREWINAWLGRDFPAFYFNRIEL